MPFAGPLWRVGYRARMRNPPEHAQGTTKNSPVGTNITVAVCGAGRAAENAGRGKGGVSESGTLRSGGQHSCMQPYVAGGRGEGMPGVPGRGQIFTAPIRAGKLKNWKSEKLTSSPATRHSRISGFQDFRFSPAPPYPKSCRRSLDGLRL